MNLSSFDGVRIAVHPFPSTGNGPDIWLSHATGFCAGCWTPVAADVMDFGGRIVAWDHRGHGRSGGGGPPLSWWEMGGDAVAVVSSFPRRGVASLGVGHSMGATALLMAEITRPGTFDVIVAVEPILPSVPLRRTAYPLAEVVRKRRRTFASREQALANYRRKAPFSHWHPEALDGFVSGGLRDNRDGVELACHPDHEAEVYETASAHGVLGLLGLVGARVEVVVGDRSDTIDPGAADRIVAALPEAALSVVPEAGHLVPMERPGEIAAIIRSLAA